MNCRSIQNTDGEVSGAALAATPALGLSKMHIPPSSSVAHVELYAGAGFMKVKLETADFLQPSCDSASAVS
jgi:hypothetical protein